MPSLASPGALSLSHFVDCINLAIGSPPVRRLEWVHPSACPSVHFPQVSVLLRF